MSDQVPASENQLTVPADAADFMVVAQRPDEMRAAQDKTIDWVTKLLAEARAEVSSAEAALESARKHKWRLEGFKRHVSEPKRKAEFYEKILAALKAGYVIVPNFPVDIFAIRTERHTPKGEAKDSAWWTHAQKSERPALGEGTYVSDRPRVEHEQYEEQKADGKIVTKHSYYPTDFLPVDFPIKLVAPQIMDATAKAMTLKAFDEMGILPARNAARRGNDPDPMMIGQIVFKPASKREKRVSFLVAWWLTEEDLRV